MGRVDLIQIREPDLDAAVLLDLVRRVAARARGTGTSVVVNDRADVARAGGAQGVHVRASGPALDRVRAFGPDDWLVGRSVHAPEEVRAHQTADYLIFGTMFPTASKPLDAPLQGLGGLREAVRLSQVPVLAIGGIDLARARECLEAGAAGVVAIGLFLPPGLAPGALGIRAAVEGWQDLVNGRG